MAGSRRRRAAEHEEGHEGSERWLVTYADMVTLLMVLFIVMFAMSQVSEEKYNSLKQGLSSGFGQSVSVLNGASHQLDEDGSVAPASIAYDAVIHEAPAAQRAALQQAISAADRARLQKRYADARAEVSRLEKIRRQVLKALSAHGLSQDVRTAIDERGLVVSLVSRHVVFEPNVAELTPRGRRVVNALAPVLRGIPEPLRVDGHTNQVKVKPKYFPTDWELSAARAVRVLRQLQEDNRIPGDRLTASAFGHEKPLVDPTRAGSQQINKRVDIIVLSQAPAETRALFAEVQRESRAAGTGAPGRTPTNTTAGSSPVNAQGPHPDPTTSHATHGGTS